MNAQIISFQMNPIVDKTEYPMLATSIQDMLLTIGIPPNLSGYAYISYAIELLILDAEYRHSITKGLYVDIAKQFHTTPARVERSIRHAIEVAWLHGDIELLDSIFKNCVRADKGRPTNSVFLARLFYHMKDNL